MNEIRIHEVLVCAYGDFLITILLVYMSPFVEAD